MSLTVPQNVLEQAERGEVSDEEFIDCIRTSLPYAWSVVSRVADRLHDDGAFADDQTPPPNDAAFGQLLRLVASDAMRGAVERHFGARIAFQNCCRVGLFAPDAHDAYEQFVSPRAQLLNQSPELVNC